MCRIISRIVISSVTISSSLSYLQNGCVCVLCWIETIRVGYSLKCRFISVIISRRIPVFRIYQSNCSAVSVTSSQNFVFSVEYSQGILETWVSSIPGMDWKLSHLPNQVRSLTFVSWRIKSSRWSNVFLLRYRLSFSFMPTLAAHVAMCKNGGTLSWEKFLHLLIFFCEKLNASWVNLIFPVIVECHSEVHFSFYTR